MFSPPWSSLGSLNTKVSREDLHVDWAQAKLRQPCSLLMLAQCLQMVCAALDAQYIFTVETSYVGGSLFLFNRKLVRFFRKDGHEWRKKTDGKTIRETHEKLKVSPQDCRNAAPVWSYPTLGNHSLQAILNVILLPSHANRRPCQQIFLSQRGHSDLQ